MNLKGNNLAQNEKPRSLAATKSQGKALRTDYPNYSALEAQKARYEKGMELYRQGRVNIASNGYFIINGFQVDTEKVACECPDYRKYKQPCKHFFAACIFQKNGGKAGKIERLNPEEFPKGNGSSPDTHSNSETSTDSNHISYNKQRVITRLTTISNAIEILKANEEPIELEEVLSVARQLEHWALGI